MTIEEVRYKPYMLGFLCKSYVLKQCRVASCLAGRRRGSLRSGRSSLGTTCEVEGFWSHRVRGVRVCGLASKLLAFSHYLGRRLEAEAPCLHVAGFLHLR